MKRDDYARLRRVLDDSRTLQRLGAQLEDEAAAILSDERDDTIDLIMDYTVNKTEMTWGEFCKQAGVGEDG